MDYRTDFAEDKAKFRSLAGASQEILTQSSVKYAEKTRANSYVDRFLCYGLKYIIKNARLQGKIKFLTFFGAGLTFLLLPDKIADPYALSNKNIPHCHLYQIGRLNRGKYRKYGKLSKIAQYKGAWNRNHPRKNAVKQKCY